MRQPTQNPSERRREGASLFLAARRWQRAPAHSRRSVGSGTLAAGSRKNDDVTGEPSDTRWKPMRRERLRRTDDVATIGAAECRTEAQRPRPEWLTTQRRRDTCLSMERAAAVISGQPSWGFCCASVRRLRA